MTKSVRVPDPVYEEIKRQAEQQDSPHGEVVRDWMEQAKKYDRLEEHKKA